MNLIRRQILCRRVQLGRCFSTQRSKYENNNIAEVPTRVPLKKLAERLNFGVQFSPYEKAARYLEYSISSVGHQTCISYSRDLSEAVPLKSEVFTPAVVYDLVAELPGLPSNVSTHLLHVIQGHMLDNGLFNFFTDQQINDDVDTTSVSLWALLHSNKVDLTLARCIAKLMSLNTMKDNDFQTNRTPIRSFIPPYKAGGGDPVASLDPVVMANVLRVLIKLQMEHLAPDTTAFISDWLSDGSKFLSGTQYYQSPDTLLFFLSNCLALSDGLKKRLKDIVQHRLGQTLGTSKTPIDLSMRLITASNLNLLPPTTSEASERNNSQKWDILRSERKLLCDQQLMDGSWPLDSFFKYHLVYFGNRTAVTAFAAKALHLSQSLV